MKSTKIQFVFANKNIAISNSFNIEKMDVGIVKEKVKSNMYILFIKANKTVEVQRRDINFIDIDKTGDDFTRKICNMCHKLLKISNFQKNQNAKNNRVVRRPSCNNCRKHIDGVKLNAQLRKKFQENKPHKTIFCCPVCKKITIAGVTSKVVLDHNHKTGKPRDWICDSCNTGIGRFKEDSQILRRAIQFIKQR